MRLTETVAQRIARRMEGDGWGRVEAADVRIVYEEGHLYGNEGLASAILQEFDEYGVDGAANSQSRSDS